MKKHNLTAEVVRALLIYNEETGEFRWKAAESNSIRAGRIAGRRDSAGRIQITVRGVAYFAHRLAWLYVHGSFPKDQIDHINGDVTDNRIANLRECNNAENAQNKQARRSTTSGYIGVTWNKPAGKWQARIMLNRESHHLGLFAEPEEAHKAYCAAKKKLHSFQSVPRPA